MLKIGGIWCPDVLMCPFCRANLSEDEDGTVRNHLMRCAVSINPRQYSQRKRGRPRKEEVVRMVEDRVPVVTFGGYSRKCANCGNLHCPGKDDSDTCDRWTIRPLSRCPLCGMKPEQTDRSVVCRSCRVTVEVPLLVFAPEEVLVEKWNRLCERR